MGNATNDLMVKILEWLDKEQLDYTDYGDYIILPTYCHNYDDGSKKLYLYKNEDTGVPLFKCFTECGKSFNIYQFIQKYYKLRNINYSWRESYQLLHGFMPNSTATVSKTPTIKMPERMLQIDDPLTTVLPTYTINEEALFPWVAKSPWYFEGIDPAILDYYGVRYNPYNQQLLIPHRDWRGSLVGYRVRHFEEEQIRYGKYRPLKYNDEIYSHPLSFNLYGWSEGFDLSKGEVYVYEAEKSVLLHADILGRYNAVALCGSNMSTWQQRFLVKAKPRIVFICPDRDYTTYNEMIATIQKYKEQTKMLQMFTDVYILVDESCSTLDHKNSPIDQTLNDFNSLKRLRLNDL